MSLQERLQKRLLPGPNGCLEWQGYRKPKGYGTIGSGGQYGKMLRTHRVAFEEANGSIPDGMCVLHSCDNPPCCNPDHLFLGVDVDNVADRDAKGRTAKGEKNGSAKLTREQVEAIRVDSRLHREIAVDYGVCRSQVSYIKRGAYWRGV